jgi:thiosulfate/3-mercaptopyruvate sulfurtransferase
VVAYDEAAEGGAARLWWLLRAHGHDRVAVLAVGLRGWRAEGGELLAAPPEAAPLPLDFREAAELAQRAFQAPN